MKRCAQCSFIYLDSDERCDLDGAPLLDVDDRELDVRRIPVQSTRSLSGFRFVWLVAAVVSVITLTGLIAVIVYFALGKKPGTVSQTIPAQPSEYVGVQASTPIPTPLPSTSPSPTPSASPASTRGSVEANQVGISSKPISTSGKINGRVGQARIRLIDGTTIQADEIWQTRDGIWYRRGGMVTLLRFNRVRSIEKLGGNK